MSAKLRKIDSVKFVFTCSTDSPVLIRGMRDTGSQSSFICERVLNKHEGVLVKVAWLVKRINEFKLCVSKLVRMQFNLSSDTKYVKLLTLPDISISSSLSGFYAIYRC